MNVAHWQRKRHWHGWPHVSLVLLRSSDACSLISRSQRRRSESFKSNFEECMPEVSKLGFEVRCCLLLVAAGASLVALGAVSVQRALWS